MAQHTYETNIIFWNANGIRYKTDELMQIMSSHKADIALISETRLSVNIRISIPGFSIYRNDRLNNIGGGTMIIIKNNIQHFEQPSNNYKNLETTAIKVKIGNKLITLVSAYNQPKAFDIRDYKKIISNGPAIIAGDFNARHTAWQCTNINKAGRLLYELSIKKDFVIVGPDSPTHFPYVSYHTPNILDIAILNDFSSQVTLETLHELDSDHLPVKLTINAALDKIISNRPNMNAANWPLFRSTLDNVLPETQNLNSDMHIEAAALNLTNSIQHAMRVSIPLQKQNFKPEKLPPHIQRMVDDRNKLLKLQRLARGRQAASIKPLINKLRVEISAATRNYKNDKWTNKVKSANIHDHTAWKLSKSLMNKANKVPPLKHNNSTIFKSQEKCDLLASTLSESFKPNAKHAQFHEHYNEVDATVKNFEPTPHRTIRKVKTQEINKLILQLKNRKAPGVDGITNEVLKQLSPKAIQSLTNIINASRKTGYFPESWKIAKVIMIPKPGKPHSDPNNYRPISLLNTMSKLAEKVTLFDLQRHIKQNQIIRKEQFGFRESHSTIQQVVRVVDNIISNRNKNQSTALLLIDLAKAFDKVWHEGLIYILINYNFPPFIIKFISSYLKNRKFFVFSENCSSQLYDIDAGVPQGSLLGPVLFNLYINQVPSSDDTELAVYADDTAVTATSHRADIALRILQQQTDQIANFCNQWRLKVNASKCEALIFNKEKKNYNYQKITFNGVNVPFVKHAKYLGIHVDTKLNWTHHIKLTASKAYQRLGMLYPMLKKESGINTKTALIIYKATILPLMTYGSPVWSSTCDTNLKNLQKLQNKVLKTITRACRYTRIKQLHSDLEVPMMCQHLHQLNDKFFQAAQYHSNDLVRAFTTPVPSPWDRKSRPVNSYAALEKKDFYPSRHLSFTHPSSHHPSHPTTL